MTVRYVLNCYNTTITVKQEDDSLGQYDVNIQSNNSPFGSGNTLYSAHTEEQAVRIANQLCAFYSMARENGYYLKGKAFTKPDRRDILAEEVLMFERSDDDMHALLTGA